MEYSVFYTPQSMLDLDEIWDGIVRVSGSQDVADRYIDGLMNELAGKKQFPYSGIPVQYRGLFTGFYAVNFKKYKAFYRVRSQRIEVLRFLLAKRDYLTVLFGEEESEQP